MARAKGTGSTEDWIRKAESDLHTARVSFENGIFDAAAFYSQQAAEKALKAVYISEYRSLWKIHDLVELARKIGAPDGILELCDSLNPHYIDARYPVGEGYASDVSAEAIEEAGKVIAWAKERMKK